MRMAGGQRVEMAGGQWTGLLLLVCAPLPALLLVPTIPLPALLKVVPTFPLPAGEPVPQTCGGVGTAR